MYERLLDETAQPAATKPATTRSTSKSSETTSAPPRKVTPDVIEVEGTQEARERGHVVIVIENADPDP